MSYTDRVYSGLRQTYAHEPEFLQASKEILVSIQPYVDLHPEFESAALLERLVEPERIISFRVPWIDDAGTVRVNRGWRVEFNSAIGPYKGGLRFHPTVTQSVLKFLGFEQIFKNSLTQLPMGGGKGGSDFNPKGKSDREVMAFCQSFMTELARHIGPNKDVPAGDIGVGAREIGYLFGQYKRLSGEWNGSITGKGLSYGGSLGRTEATGFGVIYFFQNMFHYLKQQDITGKRVNITGAGNVAIYAAQKAQELGCLVQTMSDSKGWIYDAAGIDVSYIKELKEKRRASLAEYTKHRPQAVYTEGAGVWNIPCDVYIPCATQNELGIDAAKQLVDNGCEAVVEGANMPTTLEAIDYLQHHGVLLGPAKAANAGGVAVSGLEMSQNAEHLSWTFDKVDTLLQSIMKDIYLQSSHAAEQFATSENLVSGANIAGFKRVADAMMAQGIV